MARGVDYVQHVLTPVDSSRLRLQVEASAADEHETQHANLTMIVMPRSDSSARLSIARS